MAESTAVLITAAELAERLTEVVLLDVQYALAGVPGRELYANAHLPGARFLDLDAVLAAPPGPRGRHPLPAPEQLQAGLRAVGVEDGSVVVVYDQGSSLGAARAWWTLSWAGLSSVRVLDGGLTAWTGHGGGTTGDVPVVTPGSVTVRAGAVPVLEVASVPGFIADGGALLDARTGERFRGEVEPIDTEAGHIPGALSLPVAEMMRADGRFAPPGAILAVLAEHRIPTDRPIGTSCGSGVTACQLTLALASAGVASTPYIGSWSEWIQDPRRPRAVGEP